jgi:hypothetical protein
MKKWKAWRLLGLGVCCCLLAALLAGGVLRSTALAVAQPAGPYQVAGGTMSGGYYRLTTANWQVSGTAGGGGYRLVGPAASEQAGSGCCCTYLPCVMRQW